MLVWVIQRFDRYWCDVPSPIDDAHGWPDVGPRQEFRHGGELIGDCLWKDRLRANSEREWTDGAWSIASEPFGRVASEQQLGGGRRPVGADVTGDGGGSCPSLRGQRRVERS